MKKSNKIWLGSLALGATATAIVAPIAVVGSYNAKSRKQLQEINQFLLALQKYSLSNLDGQKVDDLTLMPQQGAISEHELQEMGLNIPEASKGIKQKFTVKESNFDKQEVVVEVEISAPYVEPEFLDLTINNFANHLETDYLNFHNQVTLIDDSQLARLPEGKKLSSAFTNLKIDLPEAINGVQRSFKVLPEEKIYGLKQEKIDVEVTLTHPQEGQKQAIWILSTNPQQQDYSKQEIESKQAVANAQELKELSNKGQLRVKPDSLLPNLEQQLKEEDVNALLTKSLPSVPVTLKRRYKWLNVNNQNGEAILEVKFLNQANQELEKINLTIKGFPTLSDEVYHALQEDVRLLNSLNLVVKNEKSPNFEIGEITLEQLNDLSNVKIPSPQNPLISRKYYFEKFDQDSGEITIKIISEYDGYSRNSLQSQSQETKLLIKGFDQKSEATAKENIDEFIKFLQGSKYFFVNPDLSKNEKRLSLDSIELGKEVTFSFYDQGDTSGSLNLSMIDCLSYGHYSSFLDIADERFNNIDFSFQATSKSSPSSQIGISAAAWPKGEPESELRDSASFTIYGFDTPLAQEGQKHFAQEKSNFASQKLEVENIINKTGDNYTKMPNPNDLGQKIEATEWIFKVGKGLPSELHPDSGKVLEREYHLSKVDLINGEVELMVLVKYGTSSDKVVASFPVTVSGFINEKSSAEQLMTKVKNLIDGKTFVIDPKKRPPGFLPEGSSSETEKYITDNLIPNLQGFLEEKDYTNGGLQVGFNYENSIINSSTYNKQAGTLKISVSLEEQYWDQNISCPKEIGEEASFTITGLYSGIQDVEEEAVWFNGKDFQVSPTQEGEPKPEINVKKGNIYDDTAFKSLFKDQGYARWNFPNHTSDDTKISRSFMVQDIDWVEGIIHFKVTIQNEAGISETANFQISKFWSGHDEANKAIKSVMNGLRPYLLKNKVIFDQEAAKSNAQTYLKGLDISFVDKWEPFMVGGEKYFVGIESLTFESSSNKSGVLVASFSIKLTAPFSDLDETERQWDIIVKGFYTNEELDVISDFDQLNGQVWNLKTKEAIWTKAQVENANFENSIFLDRLYDEPLPSLSTSNQRSYAIDATKSQIDLGILVLEVTITDSNSKFTKTAFLTIQGFKSKEDLAKDYIEQDYAYLAGLDFFGNRDVRLADFEDFKPNLARLNTYLQVAPDGEVKGNLEEAKNNVIRDYVFSTPVSREGKITLTITLSHSDTTFTKDFSVVVSGFKTTAEWKIEEAFDKLDGKTFSLKANKRQNPFDPFDKSIDDGFLEGVFKNDVVDFPNISLVATKYEIDSTFGTYQNGQVGFIVTLTISNYDGKLLTKQAKFTVDNFYNWNEIIEKALVEDLANFANQELSNFPNFTKEIGEITQKELEGWIGSIPKANKFSLFSTNKGYEVSINRKFYIDSFNPETGKATLKIVLVANNEELKITTEKSKNIILSGFKTRIQKAIDQEWALLPEQKEANREVKASKADFKNLAAINQWLKEQISKITLENEVEWKDFKLEKINDDLGTATLVFIIQDKKSSYNKEVTININNFKTNADEKIDADYDSLNGLGFALKQQRNILLSNEELKAFLGNDPSSVLNGFPALASAVNKTYEADFANSDFAQGNLTIKVTLTAEHGISKEATFTIQGFFSYQDLATKAVRDDKAFFKNWAPSFQKNINFSNWQDSDTILTSLGKLGYDINPVEEATFYRFDAISKQVVGDTINVAREYQRVGFNYEGGILTINITFTLTYGEIKISESKDILISNLQSLGQFEMEQDRDELKKWSKENPLLAQKNWLPKEITLEMLASLSSVNQWLKSTLQKGSQATDWSFTIQNLDDFNGTAMLVIEIRYRENFETLEETIEIPVNEFNSYQEIAGIQLDDFLDKFQGPNFRLKPEGKVDLVNKTYTTDDINDLTNYGLVLPIFKKDSRLPVLFEFTTSYESLQVDFVNGTMKVQVKSKYSYTDATGLHEKEGQKDFWIYGFTSYESVFKSLIEEELKLFNELGNLEVEENTFILNKNASSDAIKDLPLKTPWPSAPSKTMGNGDVLQAKRKFEVNVVDEENGKIVVRVSFLSSSHEKLTKETEVTISGFKKLVDIDFDKFLDYQATLGELEAFWDKQKVLNDEILNQLSGVSIPESTKNFAGRELLTRKYEIGNQNLANGSQEIKVTISDTQGNNLTTSFIIKGFKTYAHFYSEKLANDYVIKDQYQDDSLPGEGTLLPETWFSEHLSSTLPSIHQDKIKLTFQVNKASSAYGYLEIKVIITNLNDSSSQEVINYFTVNGFTRNYQRYLAQVENDLSQFEDSYILAKKENMPEVTASNWEELLGRWIAGGLPKPSFDVTRDYQIKKLDLVNGIIYLDVIVSSVNDPLVKGVKTLRISNFNNQNDLDYLEAKKNLKTIADWYKANNTFTLKNQITDLWWGFLDKTQIENAINESLHNSEWDLKVQVTYSVLNYESTGDLKVQVDFYVGTYYDDDQGKEVDVADSITITISGFKVN